VSYLTLKLCSGRGAYEAVPDPKRQLDLPRVRSRLERAGRSVTDARVMLLVGGDPEVTIMRDGRLVIKTKDLDRAQEALRALLPVLGPGA
jgi:hypothetical protein